MVYHNYMLRENIKKKNARDTDFLQKNLQTIGVR